MHIFAKYIPKAGGRCQKQSGAGSRHGAHVAPGNRICEYASFVLITGQSTELPLDLPNGKVDGPLVICVYAEFEGDNGEIRFIGAGSRFQQVN